MAGQPGEQGPALVPGALDDVRTVPELAQLLRQLRRREARLRDESELTYRELATRTGWSRGIIGEYLAGKILPPTDRFDVLVRLLGATAAEQGVLATVRDRVEEHRRGAASSGGGPRVPRELPADVYAFTGRHEQLAQLDTSAVSVICGGAGVGKSALAMHWAHRVVDRFPDGQLHLDLRGTAPAGDGHVATLPPATALAFLLRRLGVEAADVPATPAERAARYRTLLAGRRMLVLLDDASAVEQVSPLLPDTASCVAVVTSRGELAGLVARDGVRRVSLDGLPPAEAVALLATLIGPRVHAEPAAAAALARRCAGVPLGLREVAELAMARPGVSLADLVEDLQS